MQQLSVFSTHLIQRFLLCKKAELQRSPTKDEIDKWINEDIIKNLHKQLCDQHYDPYLVLHPDFRQPLDPADPDGSLFNKCSYLVCTNKDIRDVIVWVIDHIIVIFNTAAPETIRIKLRVATSMLNDLYYKKYITKEENIYMRDHLLDNVLDFRNDYKLFELPF